MEPRPTSQVRCAYCHAPAGADARTCAGCRTVVHAECLATHGGCPTLACRKAPVRVVVRARGPSPPVGRPALPLARPLGTAALVALAGLACGLQGSGAVSDAGWAAFVLGALGLIGLAFGWELRRELQTVATEGAPSLLLCGLGLVLVLLPRPDLPLLSALGVGVLAVGLVGLFFTVPWSRLVAAEDPPAPTRVAPPAAARGVAPPSAPRAPGRWALAWRVGLGLLAALVAALGPAPEALYVSLGLAVFAVLSLTALPRSSPRVELAAWVPELAPGDDLPVQLDLADGWLEPSRHQVTPAALAQATHDPAVRLAVALAHEARGEGLEADLHLRAVLEPDREGPVAGSHVRALAHAAREAWPDALAALTGDESAEAWTLRARVRRCQGDLARALEAAERAVRAAPLAVWPREVRGRLRVLAGDLAGGLADLDLAVDRADGEVGAHLARGVHRALAGEVVDGCRDLHVALGRAPAWPLPRLWLTALGEEANVDRLEGFEADLARVLLGQAPAGPLLDAARAGPWGERSVRRRLRLAHGLLAVAAEVQGDAARAAEHRGALLALTDDGSLVRDWAMVRSAPRGAAR
ncbi:MAG: hypothetical protein KF878_00520 [Planctomycetes bacterium]|nr:hypothetical protein [Planctomycetota bacterium]